MVKILANIYKTIESNENIYVENSSCYNKLQKNPVENNLAYSYKRRILNKILNNKKDQKSKNKNNKRGLKSLHLIKILK